MLIGEMAECGRHGLRRKLRLQQVGVRAGVHRQTAHVVTLDRRDHDDRQTLKRRIGSDPPEQLEPVEVGHLEIGKERNRAVRCAARAVLRHRLRLPSRRSRNRAQHSSHVFACDEGVFCIHDATLSRGDLLRARTEARLRSLGAELEEIGHSKDGQHLARVGGRDTGYERPRAEQCGQ